MRIQDALKLKPGDKIRETQGHGTEYIVAEVIPEQRQGGPGGRYPLIKTTNGVYITYLIIDKL